MSVGATSSLTVQYCFGISPSSVANVTPSPPSLPSLPWLT